MKRENKILFAIFLAATIYLFLIKIWLYNNLLYTSDLFLYYQLILNSLKGNFFYELVYGMHLGIHTYFIILLFSPFIFIYKSAAILLLIWVIGFTSGIFPVYYISKYYLNSGAKKVSDAFSRYFPFLVSLLYLILPTHQLVFNDGLYGFHPDLLFLPAAIWLFYYIIVKENIKWYFITLILILLIKEEMSIYMITFAIYLFFKKGKRKIAFITFLISIVYFIFALYVIKLFSPQAYLETDNQHFALFSQYGSTPFEIFSNLVLHPSLIFNTRFLDQLVISSKSLFFVNLISLELTLLALPKIIINTLLGNEQFAQPWHYSEIYSFMFLAFIAGLGRLRNLGIFLKKFKIADSIIVIILLVSLTFSFINFAEEYEHRKIITFQNTPEIEEIEKNAMSIEKLIDKDKTVGVSSFLTKYFENKQTINYDQHPASIKRVIRVDPDYLVISERQLDEVNQQVLSPLGDGKGNEYELIGKYGGLILIKKL